jgi:hypothetical protein
MTLETPPPGARLVTVIEAVPTVAMFNGGTIAVNCELLTKVVPSGVPHRRGDELRAVRRECEARPARRDGIRNQRLINEGNGIRLRQRGRDGE